MKNFLKGSLAFLLLISLFSCSEDKITLTPLPEDTPPTFNANVDGTAFISTDSLLIANAYTTQVEYDFNDEDNNVIEAGTYEAIRILGTNKNTNNSIAIILPVATIEGTYYFSDTQGYFLADYLESNATGGYDANRAQTGTLTITLHNTEAHYVQGYFAFETMDYTITSGEFKTYYTINE